MPQMAAGYSYGITGPAADQRTGRRVCNRIIGGRLLTARQV